MIALIIIIISFILDGILTNFLPYMINDLSLFTPLLTIISIFFIYPFYKKKEKNYYITILILGLFYDLFYTNLLFFNAIVFLLIGLISVYIQKNFELNCLKLIIYIILIITIYELTTAIILTMFNLVPITISKIIYKISHSLLLNIIYAQLIYFIIKIIPTKYKKISINWIFIFLFHIVYKGELINETEKSSKKTSIKEKYS